MGLRPSEKDRNCFGLLLCRKSGSVLGWNRLILSFHICLGFLAGVPTDIPYMFICYSFSLTQVFLLHKPANDSPVITWTSRVSDAACSSQAQTGRLGASSWQRQKGSVSARCGYSGPPSLPPTHPANCKQTASWLTRSLSDARIRRDQLLMSVLTCLQDTSAPKPASVHLAAHVVPSPGARNTQ